MARQDRTYISVWVDRSFAERFATVARQHDRSASAEARLALKRHLESAGVEISAALTRAANKTTAAGAVGVGAAR